MKPEVRSLAVTLLLSLASTLLPGQALRQTVQYILLGASLGTIAHSSVKYKSLTPSFKPHHDALALAALPTINVLHNTNIISPTTFSKINPFLLGVLIQHLTHENCSVCGRVFCDIHEEVC